MDYIPFGRTGLKVSRLCLGTMSMGSSAWKGWVLDEGDSVPILRRALDLGINFFDMADWYSLGRNEEVVGRNLLRMSPRERLVLATKVFYPMSDDPNDRGLSRKHIAPRSTGRSSAWGPTTSTSISSTPSTRNAGRGDDGGAATTWCARARRAISAPRPCMPGSSRR